jgi:hypothetical protein
MYSFEENLGVVINYCPRQEGLAWQFDQQVIHDIACQEAAALGAACDLAALAALKPSSVSRPGRRDRGWGQLL